MIISLGKSSKESDGNSQFVKLEFFTTFVSSFLFVHQNNHQTAQVSFFVISIFFALIGKSSFSFQFSIFSFKFVGCLDFAISSLFFLNSSSSFLSVCFLLSNSFISLIPIFHSFLNQSHIKSFFISLSFQGISTKVFLAKFIGENLNKITRESPNKNTNKSIVGTGQS
ncbi:MAG: hypothetical protein LBU14_03625 [Candidatus Peribacteria bacterium]|nr:hypothetical protein [Candidatus Peribacteria bacterium]